MTSHSQIPKDESMDIEAMAVSQITAAFATCPNLRAIITTNDKTPFTDGHVDFYMNGAKNKRGFLGRVAIQVKGRTLKTRNSAPNSFSIAIPDLKAYLKLTGIIYFVVYVHKDTRTAQAYYAILNPFHIESLLNGTESTSNSVSIDMHKLPTSTDEIERIVKLAIAMQSQGYVTGFDHNRIEEISEMVLQGVQKLDLDEPLELDLNRDHFAMFAKTRDGLEFAVPGRLQIIPSDYLDTQIITQISSGEVSYASSLRRRVDKNTVEIELGESLKITLVKCGTAVQGGISLQTTDKFEHRLKDVEFFLTALESGEIFIGDQPISLNSVAGGESAQICAHLLWLRRLEALFDRLEVPRHLVSLSEISDLQVAQLEAVYESLICNSSINSDTLQAGRIFQPIGSGGIELALRNNDGTWELFDMFQPGARFRLIQSHPGSTGEEKFRLVTPYDLLDVAQLVRTWNLHLYNIDEAYNEIIEDESVFQTANFTLLRLISAADIEPTRRTEFLEAATRLSDWLLSNDSETSIHIINSMQISRRSRSLGDEERSHLRELKRKAIIEGGSLSSLIELSCAILLDLKDEVLDAIARLTPAEFDDFSKWPIWALADSAARDFDQSAGVVAESGGD